MHTSNNLCFFRLYKLAIALLFGLQFLHAQETPPIVKFSASEYGAENQNWDVTQNLQGYIYVANNEGLLEYNGSRWTLYPSFNNTAIRSLSSYKDKVYSGSYMEFGYWTKNNKGAMIYHSISESIKEKLFEDELYSEYAKSISRTANLGIADMMYDQLTDGIPGSSIDISS